jgi:hypothetical protein
MDHGLRLLRVICESRDCFVNFSLLHFHAANLKKIGFINPGHDDSSQGGYKNGRDAKGDGVVASQPRDISMEILLGTSALRVD